MALRITGSVIGEPITSSSTSATGMWTSQEVAALQKDGIWQVAPTFTLTPSAATVNEGASITVTLTTTGIPNGAVIPYVITGANVYANDSANGIITGNFVIQNGSNTISFSANADYLTEGSEYLILTAGSRAANIEIIDSTRGEDAQFPYTTLLLRGDGTNNAQNNTFLDSSINNATITRNGNSTQGAFNPYANTWSNYFDGSGDYLNYAANGNYLIGTGDFTMEFWFNTSSTGIPIVSSHQIGGMFYTAYGSDRKFNFYYNTSGGSGTGYASITSTNAIPLNTWAHIALSRNGNNLRLYINGVLENTVDVTGINIGSYGGNKPFRIGAGNDLGSYYAGYLSNFRYINGTGLYTTAFTPSTTPLTAVANTQILTCQSNRFVDNSGNNYTPTNNGDISVKKFNPFNLPSSYSTTTFGGSGYFDGTGDYLTVPYISGFDIPLNTAFTLECWVYTTTNNTFVVANRNWPYGGSGPTWAFYLNSGITPSWGIAGTGVNTYEMITSSISGNYGAWNHYVWTRDGGNVCRIFVNGIQGASRTDGQALTSASGAVYIGVSSNLASPYATGNMSNMRFVSGMAVYTGNFTPPSAPVSTSGSPAPYASTANVNTTFAAANTALLCNFTNAGIYDSTMINDFETAGDSKVSSTQSKFGGTSMYFDGTGDYIAAPASSDWALGSNCTVEFWAYPTSAPATARIINNGSAGSAFVDVYYSSGSIGFCNAGYTSNTLPLNTWTHVACVLRNGTSTIYFNGVSQALTGTTTGFDLTATAALWVGGISGYNQYYQGYLDDVRITKGYARYTSNFTPFATSVR